MAKNTGGTGAGTADIKTGDAAKAANDKAAEKTGDDKKDETGKAGETAAPFKSFASKEEFDAYIERESKKKTDDLEKKAKMSDLEKANYERDQANKRADTAERRDQFIRLSGIADYGKASRLFKLYADELETDDKGKITNAAAVLKTAKADFPELFPGKVEGSGDGGKGGESAAAGDMNSLIRRKAGKG